MIYGVSLQHSPIVCSIGWGQSGSGWLWKRIDGRKEHTWWASVRRMGDEWHSLWRMLTWAEWQQRRTMREHACEVLKDVHRGPNKLEALGMQADAMKSSQWSEQWIFTLQHTLCMREWPCAWLCMQPRVEYVRQ